MNAITGAHDIHIGKLLAQEDLKREQGTAKMTKLIQTSKDFEWQRNRTRISEIIHLREKNKDEIGELTELLARPDEDYYYN